MAELLKGAPVSEALNNKMISSVEKLKENGIIPTVGILRVGEKDEDLSYERSVIKRCDKVGVSVKSVVLKGDAPAQEVYAALKDLADDKDVHGILVFRPLPKHIDDETVRGLIPPQKDIDGCTDGSLAGVFTNTRKGFAPCTAQAVMEILKFYGIETAGRKAVVIGRSLVIGRPAAMMLMHENATVTICHTKTEDVKAVSKGADILVLASGKMESIDASYVSELQTVLDVGINWNEKKGKLCGDADFDSVEPVVKAITPVPGGVGVVTTAVLISHVVEAAERQMGK